MDISVLDTEEYKRLPENEKIKILNKIHVEDSLLNEGVQQGDEKWYFSQEVLEDIENGIF